RRQQDVRQILTTHKSAPEDRANSVRARLLRTLTVTARVRRFRRRIIRRLVILKDTRNFAEKSFFLFVGVFRRHVWGHRSAGVHTRRGGREGPVAPSTQAPAVASAT